MGTFELALFAVCALCVIGGGIATVGARRPIRSALGLLVTIVGISGCFLLLEAQFLAVVQVLVYAGAVVVLFLFVVMLLGSSATSPRDAKSAIPRYLGAAVFLAASVAAFVLVFRLSQGGARILPALAADYGSVEGLGAELFTKKIVPFELGGALLLVAVIGAMAVARGHHADPTRKSREPGPDDGASGSQTGGASPGRQGVES